MMTNTAADRYRTPRPDRWTAAGLVLLPFLVFLLSRPYIGIMHDARLYIGYSLAQLDPLGIGQDLLFTADGQSGYSIYPPILRELVRAIGPSKAAMVSAFCGLCFWFAAFHGFARRWLGQRLAPLPFAAAVVLSLCISPHYGGTGVFKFAEPYATPRVFAEALVLIALSMLMGGRSPLMASAPLALGAAIHPIMTAPAIGIVLWWAAPSRRIRMMLVALVAIGCAVVLAGGPLLGVDGVPFARFDSEWRKALDGKASLVFLRWWHPQDFTRTLLQFVTIALAGSAMSSRHRRLVISCAIVAAAGIGVTAIGADALGNILVTQAQFWRALWIVAVIASLSLPLIVFESWHQDMGGAEHAAIALRRAATLLLILAWVVVEHSVNAGTLAMLAAVLWCLPMRWPTISLPPTGIPLIATVVAGLALFMVGTQAWVTAELALSAPDSSLRTNWNYLWMTAVPAVVLAMIAALVLAHSDLQLRSRALTVCLAPLVVIAAVAWDSRTPYQTQLERALDKQLISTAAPSMRSSVAAVMWPFSDLEAWAFFGRPSWGTTLQGIPAVFSRELVMTWTSRWNRILHVGLSPAAETAQQVVGSSESWRRDESVGHLCRLPDAPESLVLPSAIAGELDGYDLTLPEAKLLQPTTRGGAWQQLRSWRVVKCETVRRSNRPASGRGALL